LGKLVSAALIVRDEERFLVGCLESLGGLVDEIVVVDTGSVDRTREIAAAHGVRLFELPWRDDFAAARNYAIDCATGDWILYIDADERTRPYDRGRLATALADPGLCVATVRFHPRTGFTAYPEHRLFRRDPRIRFRGAIHETIMPDITRLLATGEGGRVALDLTIDHLGYDGDQSHKLERNLRLLEKAVIVDPGRVYLWWHLGTVHLAQGRSAEAEAAWTHGIGITRRNRTSQPEDALCFIELAKLRMTRREEALALIREGRERRPDNLLLCWLEARALIAADRYEAALPLFERLAAIDSDSLVTDIAYDRRILGAEALAEAGHCAFLLGRYGDSAEWYGRAAARAPDRLEFRVKHQFAAQRAARRQAVSHG
jgi:glycosyltransferase involved in cell wall biosynthesis